MASKQSSLFVGKTLFPGFRLLSLRGKGGFGSVWEAEAADRLRVALKFLKTNDAQAAAQEIKTIQIVKELHHPNLIQIDRVWLHGGHIVITMELADGNLHDLLDAYHQENISVNPLEICQMFHQAAAALDFLNARKHLVDGVRVAIQHCDVKPSNMLLFGETLKLCDFGLSSITTSHMKSHKRAGTLDYAAPEVFQGRLSDSADQFSLAVSYCLVRGGRFPFPTPPRSFDKHYTRPAADLSMLPPLERPAIARALSFVPQDRWPTCGQLIDELRAALSAEGSHP